MTNLECELRLLREHMDAGFRTLDATLRAEIARAILHVSERFDARLCEVEQRMRWVTGLLITVLLGTCGIIVGLAGLWARLP